jgi:hypothetical protein
MWFFKGDIDFPEANENLTKQMLNKIYTTLKTLLEGFKDIL